MILQKNIFYLFLILILFSCDATEEIDQNATIIEIIDCTTTDISVTKEDNIIINHATNPVVWKGTYNENFVQINYTKTVSGSDETETFNFVFKKQDSCLKIDRAFKFYDGKQDDVSAITEMKVEEFYTKNWVFDALFTGQIIYTDPHSKKVNPIKFWVEFNEDTKIIENTNYLLFNACFGNKLPINIDLNADGIIDFKMDFEKIRDVGNRPNFNQYSIKLISTNEDKNAILSPRKNNGPYRVVYQKPFTSENKRQYFNDVKETLDIFYEFDAPYQNYNYFLNNNLTLKDFTENDKDDYYIISMEYDNQIFYGWIQFSFNSTNCDVEIVDTYLHTVASEHISVK